MKMLDYAIGIIGNDSSRVGFSKEPFRREVIDKSAQILESKDFDYVLKIMKDSKVCNPEHLIKYYVEKGEDDFMLKAFKELSGLEASDSQSDTIESQSLKNCNLMLDLVKNRFRDYFFIKLENILKFYIDHDDKIGLFYKELSAEDKNSEDKFKELFDKYWEKYLKVRYGLENLNKRFADKSEEGSLAWALQEVYGSSPVVASYPVY